MNRLRQAALAVSIASAMLIGAFPASATAAQITSKKPSKSGALPASALANENPIIIMPQQPPCNFTPRGDNVHISSTPPAAASAHGWWVNGDCNATTAVVVVQLQEWNTSGYWENKGTEGTGTVYSGGGSANRVTGRATCQTTDLTSWRSIVGVQIPGIGGAYDQVITPGINLNCRV